jgi:predicted dithiol-disulfide oxidoreductase (DUF899 family)
MPTKAPLPPVGHKVVSRAQWLAAHTRFLAKDKAFTRARERLAAARRALPWVKVEKNYVFEGPKGRETLADLFAGRRQLIIYHFMFDPRDKEGCHGCSFWADSFNGVIVHLNQRDVTMLAASRAPLRKLEAFKARMGWDFKWVSLDGSDFNLDYHVSFTDQEVKQEKAFFNYRKDHEIHCKDREGVSVFSRDDAGAVYHTYSSFARGIDILNTAYNYLDLVPKGRDEAHLASPMRWVDYHDKYAG